MRQLPVYVVNMTSRADRRALMERTQDRLGVNFTFIPAVDGRNPDAIVDEGIPTGRVTGRPRSRIDFAVVSSHRLCWKRIIDDDEPFGIVLEDDVVLSDDFARFTTTGWIPAGADIVKLETMLRYVEIHDLEWNAMIGRKIGRLESVHLGAAGYLITRDAARRLWNATTVPFDQIDHILFTKSIWNELGLKVVQVDPAPVVQGMLHRDHASADWAASSLQGHRLEHGMSMTMEAHRQVGGSGGLTFRKVARLKSVLHVGRFIRSFVNGGAYRRVQFK